MTTLAIEQKKFNATLNGVIFALMAFLVLLPLSYFLLKQGLNAATIPSTPSLVSQTNAILYSPIPQPTNAYGVLPVVPDRIHEDVVLDVPAYIQERALSCEVATLKMALAYKGVTVSENELMGHVGYDPTPHVGNTWGNPHQAFVGDIDGRQPTTGYGVYWEPIARAGAEYRPTEYFTNGTVQDLTYEIVRGNPVVVWGNTASGRRVD